MVLSSGLFIISSFVAVRLAGANNPDYISAFGKGDNQQTIPAGVTDNEFTMFFG